MDLFDRYGGDLVAKSWMSEDTLLSLVVMKDHLVDVMDNVETLSYVQIGEIRDDIYDLIFDIRFHGDYFEDGSVDEDRVVMFRIGDGVFISEKDVRYLLAELVGVNDELLSIYMRKRGVDF